MMHCITGEISPKQSLTYFFHPMLTSLKYIWKHCSGVFGGLIPIFLSAKDGSFFAVPLHLCLVNHTFCASSSSPCRFNSAFRAFWYHAFFGARFVFSWQIFYNWSLILYSSSVIDCVVLVNLVYNAIFDWSPRYVFAGFVHPLFLFAIGKKWIFPVTLLGILFVIIFGAYSRRLWIEIFGFFTVCFLPQKLVCVSIFYLFWLPWGPSFNLDPRPPSPPRDILPGTSFFVYSITLIYSSFY